jgi:hypothetical protein
MTLILTFRWQLPLMIFLFLLVNVNASVRGQTVPDREPITELRMPPFIFSELRGSNLEVKSVEIREGCSIQIVKWTVSSGRFTYRDEEGTIISGKFEKLTLKGKMARPDSPCGYLLEIGPGGLKFKFRFDAPFAFNAFGGTITIEPGKVLQISNERSINISKFKPVTSAQPVQVNRVGSLTLTTSERLAWRDVKFMFSELSEPVVLNLIGPNGQKKRFDLPIELNRVTIADANFLFEVPADLPAKTFVLSGPRYRATIKETHLKKLTVSVSRPGLLLRAENLSVFAQVTARSDAAPNTPVLFNGTASVTDAQSTADYSMTAAIMKDVRFSGLRLIPAPPLGASSEPSERTNRAEAGLATLRLPGQSSAFSAVTTEKHATVPSQEISNACVRIPVEQINDIKSLGMPLLSDQQAEAIKKSQEALDRIDSADFLIHLPARDLNPFIEKLGSKLGQNFRITFGKQLVTFCADISTTQPIPITLKLTVRVSPNFEVVTIVKEGKPKEVLGLVLRYEISIAQVAAGEAKQANYSDVLIAIGRVLEAAASSAADVGSKIVLPIDLDFVKTIDPNRTGKDEETGETYEVKGKKIETSISPHLDRIMLLVDANGVHVMGKVKVATKVVN